jgi:hypothetical protein
MIYFVFQDTISIYQEFIIVYPIIVKGNGYVTNPNV